MQFIDLKSQYERIKPQIHAAIDRVLEHGQYIMGPEIKELEEVLARYVGVKHCITASSGTDTLLIAMLALGIQPGDEVITVPYTWISTAEMIALIHARPVFVDIDPRTFNMDPAKLEAAITPRTKAIMPVGIYGQCADMDAINEIAGRHNLPVIEDAAQSFGATYKGGKSCALSTIGSTSFFPSKPLGCYGDGGALFTDDDELAARMRQIRVHGQSRKHHHPIIGINGRFDTLQAAILLEKFKLFPDEIERRQRAAAFYDRELGKLAAQGARITIPWIAPENTSVYAQYTILAETRDALSQKLADEGIPTVAYYIAPLHLQPAFCYLGYKPGDFPVTENISANCLSLPMSPYLDEGGVLDVVQVMASSVNRQSFLRITSKLGGKIGIHCDSTRAATLSGSETA